MSFGEESPGRCSRQSPLSPAAAWSQDVATNTYGGVYLFVDAASREDYLNSEIVSSLKASPNFTDITARTFGTFEEAPAITGGPLAAARDLEMLRL